MNLLFCIEAKLFEKVSMYSKAGTYLKKFPQFIPKLKSNESLQNKLELLKNFAMIKK